MGSAFLVTKSGGQIDFAEIHLVVPVSAVDRDISITIRRLNLEDPAIIGDAFEMGPQTVVFARPLTLKMDLPAALPVSADRVVLSGLSPPIWRRISNSVAAGPTEVTADITQLATFAAVVSCGSNEDCTTGRCDTGVCQGTPASEAGR